MRQSFGLSFYFFNFNFTKCPRFLDNFPASKWNKKDDVIFCQPKLSYCHEGISQIRETQNRYTEQHILLFGAIIYVKV